MCMYASMGMVCVHFFLFYPISSNESDEDDYHQRVCLHAEILVPFLGKVY